MNQPNPKCQKDGQWLNSVHKLDWRIWTFQRHLCVWVVSCTAAAKLQYFDVSMCDTCVSVILSFRGWSFRIFSCILKNTLMKNLSLRGYVVAVEIDFIIDCCYSVNTRVLLSSEETHWSLYILLRQLFKCFELPSVFLVVLTFQHISSSKSVAVRPYGELMDSVAQILFSHLFLLYTAFFCQCTEIKEYKCHVLLMLWKDEKNPISMVVL